MIHSLKLLDIIFSLLGLFILHRLLRNRTQTPFPPGPKGLPLIGNTLDIPRTYEWLTFSEWAKRWGAIIYLRTLGHPIIILSSYEEAVDMLEKKSSIYSDRPVPITAMNAGFGSSVVLTQYGDNFRVHRRFMNKTIGYKDTLRLCHGLIENESRKFIRRVLTEPDRIREKIRKTAGAIILMITYGYSVQEGSDHFVNLADTVMSNFALAGSPGTFMVDIVPVLQYLPKWLPGMRGYWKTMASWRKETELMFDEPYQFAKAQFKNNGIVPSLVSLLLESEISCTDEANIKLTAGSLYGAGADTTVSANYSFLLAMTLNSSIQAKAQEEIDKVIGNSRLPTIADRDNLPYINALVKEVFRWNSITPLGMPHRVIRDDIHKGYFIPKGSTVIVNAWHLLHDPDVYADPLSFNPNRFLGDNPERDPRKIVFGFGRRICPGLNLADTSVFIFCALSLAVFNVSKVVRDGVVVEPICEWETGVVSHPKDFECSIKPRSAKARELILMEEDSLK